MKRWLLAGILPVCLTLLAAAGPVRAQYSTWYGYVSSPDYPSFVYRNSGYPPWYFGYYGPFYANSLSANTYANRWYVPPWPYDGLTAWPQYRSYYSYPAYYSPGYSVPGSTGISAAVAPSNTEGQAVRSAAASKPNEDRAVIRVTVPAGAKVWFEETLTQLTGTNRVFYSPPLTRDKTFSYSVRALWTENGREVTRKKRLLVRAGQTVTINFMDAHEENARRPAEQEPVRPPMVTPRADTERDRPPDRGEGRNRDLPP